MHCVEKVIAGKKISLETGKVALQASGSVVVRCGESMVLCVVVEGNERPGIDFFPLMCDYREKYYAAGKIPGSFMKREARPSDRETLTSRMMDRPLRPNFPNGYKNDVNIECQVLSYDVDAETDILAMIGASAALAISHIPCSAILGAVRIGYVNDELVVNPDAAQRKLSRLDLIVSGSKDSIMMVESCADELSEDIFVAALDLAQKTIAEIVALQEELVALAGVAKAEFGGGQSDNPYIEKMLSDDLKGLENAFNAAKKHDRALAVSTFKKSLAEKYLKAEDGSDAKVLFDDAFGILKHHAMRELIFSGSRCDGRSRTDVRPITCDTSYLPRAHGSAIFQRGETQALVSVTLGTSRDAQLVDDLNEKRYNDFLFHYNFPSWSVGETGGRPGPGRREIGHGNLAMRALKAVLPNKDDFPYTLRIVSDILSCNGSSSMASVCGGSLAMMDAGIPIKAPVAGIAMGLISDGKREAVITDILGDEDHYGDMDFKVAGTADGITALQMDIKIQGLKKETMVLAMTQAKAGRLHILGEMAKAIATSREEMSNYAPRIVVIKIESDLIGKLIGPGGSMIRKIQEESGAEIEVDDTGKVKVFANNNEARLKAEEMIKGLTSTPEVGKVYEGTVNGVREFGAFVDILPGTSGLLHVSEISSEFVKDINTVCQIGDKIRVVVTEIDRQGKLRLMREEKYLQLKEAGELPTAREGGKDREGGRRERR